MFKESGRWRMTEAYLSYKLTKWAFGSGELITTLYLKTIWLRIVIFGTMDQCDIKIGLIKYMWVSDLYFMVQWLSYVCKTILWMHVIFWTIVQYNTKIDITCSWYFEGYLLDEHHIWDNGSVWHKDWPHKVYVGQWPIFRGTVILPYILTVNCKLHVFWLVDTGGIPALWALTLVDKTV